MNCQGFQDKVFEYLDEELSASAQSEIEAHLESCAACRHVVQTHRALAARIHRETAPLLFRPEWTQRMEAALAEAPNTPAWEHPVLGFWRRFAWPVAIAAALLAAGGLSFRQPFHPRVQSSKAALRPVPATISVRFSSCDPAYTFRWEHNLVVDALTCTPCVVEENHLLSLNQKHIPPTQERKTPL